MADETAAMDTPATADEPKKFNQKVDISDVGPCKKHVKVTIDRSVIDARLDEKFSDLMVKTPARIPGFRTGKAPKQVVRRKFSKEVASEVRTEVLMASLEQLAEENTLSPLGSPELDPTKVLLPEKDGEPMVYEFDIEVRPEFDLPEYKNLKLRKPTYTFTDADVEKEKRKLLERAGTIVPKDGEVALDDIITTSIVIHNEGKELNKVDDIRLRVEKKLALEDGIARDFGKAMVGAKVGESRKVDITLSNELVDEALRGKVVNATFTVTDLKTVRLPELTDTVLESFGVRTTDAFDELVRTRLERFLDYTQRNVARTEVLRVLAGEQKWDLPQDLLQRQARKTLSRRVMEMRNSGMSDEQIIGRQRELELDALRSTASALKEHFVLQKIAETEKIEIEDSDIEDEIDRIADRSGESPRKVRARLEREDLIETVATELLERKALDLVLETATYDEYNFNPMQEQEDNEISTAEASAAS
jgi:trigger factor